VSVTVLGRGSATVERPQSNQYKILEVLKGAVICGNMALLLMMKKSAQEKRRCLA
jgi:hypothetical protein